MPYGTPGDLRPADVGIKAGPVGGYLYAAPTTDWAVIAMTHIPVVRCAACHGSDGTGDVTRGYAQNLTIQSADYLAATLRAYGAGERKSGITQGVAAGLSEGQIDALAASYDALPATPAQSPGRLCWRRARRSP